MTATNHLLRRSFATISCILAGLMIVSCGEADEQRNNDTREERAASAAPDPVHANPVECQNDWRQLEEGLSYRTLNCAGNEFDFHLVRVDPGSWSFEVDSGEPSSAAEAAQRSGAVFAINANFFDPQGRPLGVLLSGGREIQRVHPVAWESIFLVTRKGTPKIVLPAAWPDERADAVFAVQAGPRLVVNGNLVKVVPGGPGWRSGVCIQPDDRVVFFTTAPSKLMTATDAGRAAHRSESDGGMGCRNAMLFDGGPSAQLYLNAGGTTVEIVADKVPAFVVIKRR